MIMGLQPEYNFFLFSVKLANPFLHRKALHAHFSFLLINIAAISV